MEKGLTGLEAFVLAKSEHAKLDSMAVQYFRVLMKGSATNWSGSHAASLSNCEVLREWRILPSSGELAVRRARWLLNMIRHPAARRQTIDDVATSFMKPLP